MTNSGSNKSVLALGELLWDVLPNEKLLGGAPANFCYRLRQLGIPARMVSRVGVDALGEELLSQLRERSFDVSLIQRDPSIPTGTVDVVLTAEGNPSFTINTGVAYDFLEATPELLAAAAASDLICFGTLVQRSATTRDTIYKTLDAAVAATKFLDINLRRLCYSADTVVESLKRADILKLNLSEVKVVSDLLQLGVSTPEEMSRVVIDRFGIRIVLVTLGEAGVYAVDSTGLEVSEPGLSVSVVDTIGSGDSFSAGFVSKYLEGAALAECCRFGNLMGAMNATRKGGMPEISVAEIKAFASSAHAQESLC
jgi:fructokinase